MSEEVKPTGGRTAAEEVARDAAIARSHTMQEKAGVLGSAATAKARSEREAKAQIPAPAEAPATSTAPKAVPETTPLTKEERGFEAKPDWKPVEFAHKSGSKDPKETDPSKPTVYVDPSGTRHYTPLSPMWETGFRTSQEYSAAQKTGKPAPYVAVDTPEGSKHVTVAEAQALSVLPSKEAMFAEMQKLGIYSKDYQWHKSATGEGIITGAQVSKLASAQASQRSAVEARTALQKAGAISVARDDRGKVQADKGGNIIYNIDVQKAYEAGVPFETAATLGITGASWNLAKDWKTVKSFTDTEGNIGYAGVRGALGAGVAPTALISFGITQEFIDEAKAQRSPAEAQKPEPWQSIIANKGFAAVPQIPAVTGKTTAEISFLPAKPLTILAEKYAGANPPLEEFTQVVRAHYGEAAHAEHLYKQVYGADAYRKAAAISTATEFFAPARALEETVAVKQITPLEWGIGVGQVALMAAPVWIPKIPGLRVKTPKPITVKYATISETGFPITSGRATGVPIRGMRELPHMEGRLWETPIGYVKEGPLSIKQVSGLSSKGYQPISSTRIYGETGETIKFITPAEALGASASWQMKGGIRIDPRAISSKKMGVPISPELSPPTGKGRGVALRPPPFVTPTTSVAPSTATMTLYQVTKASPVIETPFVVPTSVVATEVPFTATEPMQVGRITMPTPPTPPVMPTTFPATTPAVAPIPTPSKYPSSMPIITPVSIKTILGSPTPITVSTSAPAATAQTTPVRMPVVTPAYTPAPTDLKPFIYEPPPIQRRPTKPPEVPVIFPPTPKFPALYLGRGYQKHGLQSSYVKYTQDIPELVVYLPEWEGLKPAKIGKRKWRMLGGLPSGVELLGEEEFEMTPFGKKAVKTVVARAKLSVGAKRAGQSLAPAISKKETALGARYYLGHELPPAELGGL